jgi:surfeit locus 1 family protein
LGAAIIAPGGKERVTRRGTLRFGWTVALLAIAGFAWLGFWQNGRMHEKQALLAQVDRVMRNRQPVALDGPLPAELAWIEGDATLDPRTLLLDNQLREGRPGVHVYCLALTHGGARLLDLGWTPMRLDRTVPDDIVCPAGPLHVRGLLLAPPSSGVRMGPAMQQVAPSRWLMTRVDAEAISKALGVSIPARVVRLDPALEIGWARDLDVLPNTLPPERHLGYAVQWWALALAVLVTALVLTFRKKKPRA